MDYSQEQINQILLSKKINDFYIAILESRPEPGCVIKKPPFYISFLTRTLAVLTMVNDQVYDIGSFQFVDLEKEKIIHYDNLADYYDETNARVKIYTPEEEPQIEQNTALLYLNDESIIEAYEASYFEQKENKDLTDEFLCLHEKKEKPNILSKKQGKKKTRYKII